MCVCVVLGGGGGGGGGGEGKGDKRDKNVFYSTMNEVLNTSTFCVSLEFDGYYRAELQAVPR